MRLFRIILTVLMISAAAIVFAADGGKKKRTTIDFDDQLIRGELKKPELFYILQKKQFNFGRLIKLRENFLPEMKRTAEELQRGSASK